MMIYEYGITTHVKIIVTTNHNQDIENYIIDIYIYIFLLIIYHHQDTPISLGCPLLSGRPRSPLLAPAAPAAAGRTPGAEPGGGPWRA